MKKDVEMRTADLSPYNRSTIGYDRMLALLEALSRREAEDVGPPYDIELIGEDRYRITMAVAGFATDELSVLAEPNTLIVEGAKRGAEVQRTYLHQGIPQNAFRRRFELADFVFVTGAACDNGLLSIDLAREIPEAMKPRQVEISGATPETTRASARRREVAE
jgi:molecular chaperone IbpA